MSSVQVRLEIPPDVEVEVVSKNGDGSPSVLLLTPTFYRGDAKPVVGFATVQVEHPDSDAEPEILTRSVLSVSGKTGELNKEKRGKPVRPAVLTDREKGDDGDEKKDKKEPDAKAPTMRPLEPVKK